MVNLLNVAWKDNRALIERLGFNYTLAALALVATVVFCAWVISYPLNSSEAGPEPVTASAPASSTEFLYELTIDRGSLRLSNSEGETIEVVAEHFTYERQKERFLLRDMSLLRTAPDGEETRATAPVGLIYWKKGDMVLRGSRANPGRAHVVSSYGDVTADKLMWFDEREMIVMSGVSIKNLEIEGFEGGLKNIQTEWLRTDKLLRKGKTGKIEGAGTMEFLEGDTEDGED